MTQTFGENPFTKTSLKNSQIRTEKDESSYIWFARSPETSWTWTTLIPEQAWNMNFGTIHIKANGKWEISYNSVVEPNKNRVRFRYYRYG
jgi:hypothetical protein